MKKEFLMIILISIILITGCNVIEEQKAERIIKKYYNAIMHEDYEKAFEVLFLFDYDSETGKGHYTDGTTFSEEEAKTHYLKKIKDLKEQNYKLIDFEIVEIEYEDGHSFWHHLKLLIEQDGQNFERNEVAIIYKGKLVIGIKDDLYAKYRDGQLEVK